ncbi:alpha/beta hydrolase [Pseudonocardia acaciae]|uniref:alpha/beta hydrolase n=1 Tax=Pseudonocardia acaciae TaxID=551276 RepID=UPI0009FF1431|nr:alpha/beta hydrolase [Pseudonocardia acaciae]
MTLGAFQPDRPVAGRTHLVVEWRSGTSRRSRALALGLRMTVRPALGVYARSSTLPWPYRLVDWAALGLRPLRGTRRRRVRLDGCGAEWLRAPGGEDGRYVLYLHGGAFVCCGLRTHRRLVSRISAAAGATMLAVDYRMLPRHPISTAVADGLHGYRWLLDRGVAPERIVLAGDSAGGALAFLVGLAAAEQGLRRPAGIAALSPLTDFDLAAKLAHPNARLDPLFAPGVLPVINDLADRASEHLLLDGRTGTPLSPVDGDLEVLPRTLIQVGSTELLLPDAELMGQALAAAGVPCRLQVWERQPHVFQAAADFVPEARTALTEVGRFIRAAVPAG